MNTIEEIKRINERELQSGSKASWHDQYKDSAYVYVGGLPHVLTEGDVIAICSQYGEVVDITLPRDPSTQKPKGFAFLMYADQRSTVLAVDNLSGAKVAGRILKVDHVLNYKQLEIDNDTGKMKERETQSLAAHPDRFNTATNAIEGGDGDSDASDSSHPSIDPEDPMREYIIQQKRQAKKSAHKREGKDSKEETKEERKIRREAKRKRKLERGDMRSIERSSKDGQTHRRSEPQSHGSVERRNRSRSPESNRRMSSERQKQHGGRYEDRPRSRYQEPYSAKDRHYRDSDDDTGRGKHTTRRDEPRDKYER